MGDEKIIEFVEKNFAGLDPRTNSFWGHDTEIGTKEEIVKKVKDFILEQAIAELDKRPTIQEIKELIKKGYADLVKENIDLKSEMQKQRQEILEILKCGFNLLENNRKHFFTTNRKDKKQ